MTGIPGRGPLRTPINLPSFSRERAFSKPEEILAVIGQ